MTVIEEIHKDMRELSDSEWQRQLEALGDETGYYERLGWSHGAFFADEGPVLLVSFEARGGIRARSDDQMPLGYSVAQAGGWSSLTLICDHDTWFRDPAVYAYFDRLVDEAFFEDFDRVIFYGTGPAGYAAAAFSVTAPGATVIAIQPQATLDPRLSGWDDRFAD
ncbi:MAG: phosphoadenosine phosphosulfate reductase, partial [Paracoccaceae bacterium]|nr:phosphoadenosine phosphosulfate reductase [Paracoccaceae bacterium]